MPARGRRLNALALAVTAAAAIGSAPAAPNSTAATARRPPKPTSPARHYKGLTSQHEPISFTLASGHVTQLSFWVVMTCASHHRYRVRAFGFAPIAITKDRFHKAVASAHPAASATVSGRIAGRRVTGTLKLRRYVAAEHGYCAGTSAFALLPPDDAHAGLRPQRPGTTISSSERTP